MNKTPPDNDPTPAEPDDPSAPGDTASNAVELPRVGVLLGIDFGQKRLGFAISTSEQTLSSPLENYTRRTHQLDAARLAEHILDYRVAGIVIGLPLHVGGEESRQSKNARRFGAWVTETTHLPITFHDERYTSTLADDLMLQVDMSRQKRKERRDMLAAHLILQSFLDLRLREGSS